MIVCHVCRLKPDLFTLKEQRSIISKQIKEFENQYRATSDLKTKNELLCIQIQLKKQAIQVQQEIIQFYEEKNSYTNIQKVLCSPELKK